ncbi:MAG TPA: DUF6474 family protein [Actinophytocola sp.]|uniref:DUF6474 family protein n=1 Tax=Actinophytocola sp. TaxID=1872138 RepID=UPI002DBB9326|nr:DUF6474 family protein [Actinophytocola sp.]HEU5473178.1 DUF6474 family protein [Actinophytocola sp.]
MATRKSGAAGAARITPAKAKNAVAVAKVLAPAVLPVLAPIMTRTAGTVRDRWDRRRARRLGIAVEELARYSGRGGALHARLAGVAVALAEQRGRPNPDLAFLDATDARLAQLTAAVRVAERMPSARRRAAHRAVAADLTRIEQDLLRRLGV